MLRCVIVGFCLAGSGCINYRALAHKEAVHDLACPEEQIVVQDGPAGYRTYGFAATGCGHTARYRCWDDSPGGRGVARTAQEAQQENPVCSLVSSTIPGQGMSAGESGCRSQCATGRESCISGCKGDRCWAICQTLEDGCIQGCINALPPG